MKKRVFECLNSLNISHSTLDYKFYMSPLTLPCGTWFKLTLGRQIESSKLTDGSLQSEVNQVNQVRHSQFSLLSTLNVNLLHMKLRLWEKYLLWGSQNLLLHQFTFISNRFLNHFFLFFFSFSLSLPFLLFFFSKSHFNHSQRRTSSLIFTAILFNLHSPAWSIVNWESPVASLSLSLSLFKYHTKVKPGERENKGTTTHPKMWGSNTTHTGSWWVHGSN